MHIRASTRHLAISGEPLSQALPDQLVGVYEHRIISGSCSKAMFSGTAIIEVKSAKLFTDGRYFLQAGQQLDHNWTLMKHGEKSNA